MEIYYFILTRDLRRYCAEVPCASWEEAEALAEKNGWELDGVKA